jgi:hypothetical protein
LTITFCTHTQTDEAQITTTGDFSQQTGAFSDPSETQSIEKGNRFHNIERSLKNAYHHGRE